MKRFWIGNLIITLFVFFMMWGASKLFDLKLFSAFDPVGQALSDFEMTDYAFSNLRPPPDAEDRIVLVNIGDLTRIEVAQQISIISRCKPKVIAIDAVFSCEGGLYDTLNCPQLKDTLANLFLANAIQEAGNVVLVSKLLQTRSLLNSDSDSDIYDSMEYADPHFSNFSTNAFANLPTGDKEGIGAASYQEDVKICRSFFPKINVKGKDELAFSVATAMKFDSIKTLRFLNQAKFEELINFRGNFEIQDIRVHMDSAQRAELSSSGFTGRFAALDVIQVLTEDFDSTMLKDRIVLMGFLGSQFGDPSWGDKFFTPLNKKVAGRANPDMFGLVVHANIIAMILNDDYIDEFPDWLLYSIAIISCLLIVALFNWIDHKLPTWFDALQVLIQIVLLLLTSGLVVYGFVAWSLKLDLSLTLASTAFVGPCYDIFKSIENSLKKK